ncbi:hypothetical protein CBM2634_B60038 [Cupriavidus taiwanensis]|uniref:Uncharacterized protein n=1 Tax=Cupriavidus taiwanensis TaxID=164546 RepID=A0A375JA40_9BURK|nr:hypothetical protein CBM2634_B60038 [Cupriavidus taiwanensis]
MRCRVTDRSGQPSLQGDVGLVEVPSQSLANTGTVVAT